MEIHSTDPGQEKLLSWLAEHSLHVCLSSQVATSPSSFTSDSLQLCARALSYHNQQLSILGVSAMDQHWLLSFSFFPRMDFLLQHPRFTNFFCKQLLFGDWAFQNVVTGIFVCLLFNLKTIPVSPASPCHCHARVLQPECSGLELSSRQGMEIFGRESWHLTDQICCGWRTSPSCGSCSAARVSCFFFSLLH